MLRKICLLNTISWFTILIATSCSLTGQQYYNDGVSDEEYIRIASEAEEAQAFLEIFPTAAIVVDRSSKLAVDFRFDKVTPTTTNQFWEGIRIRIFIDPKDKQVADVFMDCKDNSHKQNYIEVDLIEYLEQYAKNQICPIQGQVALYWRRVASLQVKELP